MLEMKKKNKKIRELFCMEQYMLAESRLHLMRLKDYKKGLSISLPLSPERS